jgi:hypothetical protein
MGESYVPGYVNYRVSLAATAMHDIPRPTSWAVDTATSYATYWGGVALWPAILLLLVLTLQAAAGCCCGKCTAGNGARLQRTDRRGLFASVAIALLLMIVGLAVAIWGATETRDGVNTGTKAFNDVVGIFSTASDTGSEANDALSRCSGALTSFQANCPEAPPADINEAKNEIQAASSQISTYLSDVTTWENDLVKWQGDVNTYSGWQFWITLAVVVVYLFGAIGLIAMWVTAATTPPVAAHSKKEQKSSSCCKCNCFMVFLKAFNVIVLVFFAIYMLVAVAGGDLCVSPDTVIQDQLSGQIQEYTQYYTTCDGPNSLLSAIADAQTDIASVESSLASARSALPACSNTAAATANLDLTSASLNEAVNALVKINSTISCSKVNGIYSEVVYSGACNDLLNGSVKLWAGLIAAALAFAWVLLFQGLLEPVKNEDEESIVVVADVVPEFGGNSSGAPIVSITTYEEDMKADGMNAV